MKKIIVDSAAKLLGSETFWIGMVIVNWLFLSSKTSGTDITTVLKVLGPSIFAYKGFKKHVETRSAKSNVQIPKGDTTK